MYVALFGNNVSNISWVLVPARWSSKAFFLLLLLIPDASTKYQKLLSHFSHLWAADVGSPLMLNGAIDRIPKFAAAIRYKYYDDSVVFLVIMSAFMFAKLLFVIQSQYRENNNISTMSLKG